MTVTAKCHCGSVSVQVPEPPSQITECHCSICSKLGVLWAYYPDAEVRTVGETETYVCNYRVIAFHRCRECGCTAYRRTLERDFGRMGINARLFEDIDLSAIARHVTEGPT